MDDKQIEGGAGPALAAHSKDASAPGSPAASAQPSPAPSASSMSDTVSQLAGQAREAADKVVSSVTDMAGQAREQLAQRGVTTEQVGAFVQEKPLVALFAAGGVGMILGMLLSRR